MKIYIGSDYNGNPTSVLLAKSRERADLVWLGMKESPHSVEEIDPNANDIGAHGVVMLLTSVEKRLSGQYGTVYREWKRGL